MQNLPNQLKYNQIKPVGYPSQVKLTKFAPTSFSSATNSDVIRFNITSPGFWDPYSAYFKIEVDVTDSTTVSEIGGVLQVDNSAHSFIDSVIIYCKGTEIERIHGYDNIAAILNDMAFTPEQRKAKSFEGMNAYNGITEQNQLSNNVQFKMVGNTTGANVAMTQFGVRPWDFACTGEGTLPQSYIPQLTDASLTSNAFIDATYKQRIEAALLRMTSLNTIQGAVDGRILYSGAKSGTGAGVPGSTHGTGFIQPSNYSMGANSGETVMSKNTSLPATYRGLINQAIKPTKHTFCIPILSGLLGILMPKDSYRYLPMAGLEDLIIEVYLSPYGMFTSGYTETATDTVLTSVQQQQRNWKITKCEINVEIQYFEPSIEKMIIDQLNSENGIVLHTCSWMQGPSFNIQAGQSPSGTYQVNLGFESLKNIVALFRPLDHINYSFCRKQYRISHNLSAFQLKIGLEYYPQTPITGHAGTSAGYPSTDTEGNNSEFVIKLYETFGKFNNILEDCYVNTQNFAINGRVYDPTQMGSFANTSSGIAQITNLHTAWGMAWWHENRCVGRALYAMNLETLNNDWSVISGINTINNRPFEIRLQQGQGTAFTRNSQMEVYCQYDMIVQLRKSGVSVLGKG